MWKNVLLSGNIVQNNKALTRTKGKGRNHRATQRESNDDLACGGMGMHGYCFVMAKGFPCWFLFLNFSLSQMSRAKLAALPWGKKVGESQQFYSIQ